MLNQLFLFTAQNFQNGRPFYNLQIQTLFFPTKYEGFQCNHHNHTLITIQNNYNSIAMFYKSSQDVFQSGLFGEVSVFARCSL